MRTANDQSAGKNQATDAACVPQSAFVSPAVPPWGGHPFACCLTHDVDHIEKYTSLVNWLRRAVADLVRRRNPAMMVRRIAAGPAPKDCRKDLDWLIETEKRLGVTASYFFLAHANPPPGEYPLIAVKEMILAVEEAGMEAGLHGSLESYKDFNMLAEEKSRLDTIVRNKRYGIRQHYLNFTVPDTWRHQARAGFLYDCTFGNRDREGARGGAVVPFRPVDPLTGREIGIWEIPLTVMDGTLAQYRKLSPERGLQVMKDLVLKTKEAHGVFCLLWHNSSLDEVDWRGWRDAYLRTLDFILENGGWIASGREIIDAWESRIGK